MNFNPTQPRNWLFTGLPGVGKTTAAASFVRGLTEMLGKPAYIFMFDQPGKEQPFLDLGDAQGIVREESLNYQLVNYPGSEEVMVTVEYFFDLNPAALVHNGLPSAYEQFQGRILDFNWSSYSVVVLDSLTSFRNAVINLQKFRLNPIKKANQEQNMNWFNAASGAIVSDINTTCCWAPCHFICLAHASHKGTNHQGQELFGVSAPGQLSLDMPGAFSEAFFQFAMLTEKGMQVHWLTQFDGVYPAQTHIKGMPQQIQANFDAIVKG